MQGLKSSSGTVRKALAVLDQVAEFGEPVRFADMQEHSDLPKGTLYRMLQTLRAEGMLNYDEKRQTYAPGMRLVRLAHTAWTQSSLAPIARPFLDQLSAEVRETIHLAQLVNGQVLYVDKRNAERPVDMFSQAGKVGPAYCTGVGKVMLAHLAPPELERALDQQSFHGFTDTTLTDRDALRSELETIRAQGHGFDREEHEPGIICVALPVLSGQGQLFGAISITGTTERTSLGKLAELVPMMQQTADQIAGEAALWHFPVAGRTAQQAKG